MNNIVCEFLDDYTEVLDSYYFDGRCQRYDLFNMTEEELSQVRSAVIGTLAIPRTEYEKRFSMGWLDEDRDHRAGRVMSCGASLQLCAFIHDKERGCKMGGNQNE